MLRYTYLNTEGKRSVETKRTFIDVLSNRRVLDLNDFLGFLDECESVVKSEAPEITPSAFGNCRGTWYEYLIAVGALEYARVHPCNSILIKLPSVNGMPYEELYEKSIWDLISDFRKNLDEESATLPTSNPDFVILGKPLTSQFLPDQQITEKFLSDINSQYVSYKGTCELPDIRGYLTVKTSERPDRRYQAVHEGSSIRALHQRIQVLQGLIGVNTSIKFYCAFPKKVGPNSEAVLRAVSTPSIAPGREIERAIDQIYVANSGLNLDELFSDIT